MKVVHYPDRNGNIASKKEKTYSLTREISLYGIGKMVMVDLKNRRNAKSWRRIAPYLILLSGILVIS